MKFYKGDYVKTPEGNGEVTQYPFPDDDETIDVEVHGISCYYHIENISLIRRADEPAWPDDVPRCELPLPEGERYAFTGYHHWSSPGQLFYWNGKWSISHGPVAGDPKLPTCKSVNDEDYVPPQLSETTNSLQVKSKINIESLSRKVTHKDLSEIYAIVDGGRVTCSVQNHQITFKHREDLLATIELLTAAAKEAQK